MRLGRIFLGSIGILLAVLLVVCVVIVLFFPRAWFEERLKESLNRGLHPLHVDFSGCRAFWKEGPVLVTEELRLFLPGTSSGREPVPLLAVPRITVRPTLEDLVRRRIDARLVLEAPAFRAERPGGEVPWAEGIAGALFQGPGDRPRGPDDSPEASPPSSLSALVPLPAGLTLSGATLEIRDGSLEAGASQGLTGVQGSVRIASDLSFQGKLSGAVLRWSREEKCPFRVSANLEADIRGRPFASEGSQVTGTLRLEQASITWQGRTGALPEAVQLSLRLEVGPEGTLSAPEILLAGSGLAIRLGGSVGLQPGGRGSVFRLRDLRAEVSEWEPFRALLFPETRLSGRLSLVTDRLEIDPGRVALPRFPHGSFLARGPEGISLEGFELQFTEGRFSGGARSRARIRLEGIALHVEQQEGGWVATAGLTGLEVAGERALRVSGPLSARAEWRDGAPASRAGLAIELSGGRLACGDLLDKPPDTQLALAVDMKVHADERLQGEAALRIGETELILKGTLENPGNPFLKASLAPGTVSLEDLAALSPALREHGLGGTVEIRAFGLAARTGAIRESGLLEARLAGKDLTLHGTSFQGLYAQARYADRKLKIEPVVLQPATGMIHGAFSADFTRGGLEQDGLWPCHGTLQIDHVELAELVRLAWPGRAERETARGSADANIAFRGAGFSWPKAAAHLQGQARISLDAVRLEGAGGSQEADGEMAAGLDRLLNAIDTEDWVPRESELFRPDEQSALAENRAAGWFTLREGSVRTDNLVVVCDGRLVEIQGTLGLDGRLQVEEGKLFTGGRMIPFRLDCGLGEEPCKPSRHPDERTDSAEEELSESLRLLAEGTLGVYGDLRF